MNINTEQGNYYSIKTENAATFTNGSSIHQLEAGSSLGFTAADTSISITGDGVSASTIQLLLISRGYTSQQNITDEDQDNAITRVTERANAHENNSVVHITAAEREKWNTKVDNAALFDISVSRHRTLEGEGNASLHWLQLDARRVPAGRLQAIEIPCRSNAATGVCESPVWLVLWERPEDGADWVVVGSSVEPVQQVAGETARWEFDGVTLSGRVLRICASAEPGVWSDDQWLGVRMAPREDGEESSARGSVNVHQVTDMTFEIVGTLPKFAAAADVEGHVADATVHVTADDRARWDAAAGGGTVSGDYAAASHVGDATHLQNGGQKLVVKGMDGGTKFTVQGLLTNAQVTGSALHVNVPDFTQRSTSVCLYSNSDTASYIPWFAAAIDATPLEAFGITKPGVHIGNTNYPVRIHGSDVYINDVPLFAEGGEVVEDGGLVSAHARERWDAAAADVEGHVADATVHVTADDRARWDAAAGGGTVSGDYAAASHVGDATHLQRDGRLLRILDSSGGTALQILGNGTNATLTAGSLYNNVPDWSLNTIAAAIYDYEMSTGVTDVWFAATTSATALAPLGVAEAGVHVGNANYPLRLQGTEVSVNGVPLDAQALAQLIEHKDELLALLAEG